MLEGIVKNAFGIDRKYIMQVKSSTLENLISVLTRTTLHYKIPPQHGLIGYLHAQCHPRHGAPRLPNFFLNVPNFKLFTVPKQKTNQIVFFNQKSIFIKRVFCSKNGGFAVSFLKMPLDIGLKENPLEHAY